MPRPASALAALLLGALACAPLHAQVLYKWVDAQGRVQYSDQPPKNFKGELTRIEPDIAAKAAPIAPVPAPAPAAAPIAAEPEAAQAPVDLNTQRRNTRATLEARVKAARESLEAARKALESGTETESGERQMIQKPSKSMYRSNCRPTKDGNGKSTIVCPISVPNEKYYERQGALEEAVKRAQADLDEAQAAWRRGVD